MNIARGKAYIKLDRVEIIRNIEISPSVYLLAFKREFEFAAGQVLAIALSPNDDARLYSIASGENDPEIEILYNIKPGGQLTPNLANLQLGDSLWISPPFGSYSGTAEPAYWIAAGTGIAPFVSMFRSGLGKNKVLIHGGRSADSFYFNELLKPAFGERYVRCSSQISVDGIFAGRVTDFIEMQTNLPRDQKYYLCGSAEMVVDCREILLAKGISFNNIVAEIYF